MTTLEDLCSISDEEVSTLLSINRSDYHLPIGRNSRLLLIKTLASTMTTVEQAIVGAPDFNTMILEGFTLDEILIRTGYTTLRQIWNMDDNAVYSILKIVIPDVVIGAKDNKWLLAKEYLKEGRIIDGFLLNLPDAKNFIFRHGVDALKVRYSTRKTLATHFDELGLADVLHDYLFEPKYIYLSGIEEVHVYDPATHLKVRTIALPGLMRIAVEGVYGDLLYLTEWIPGSHFVIYSVTLSSPTIVTKVIENAMNPNLYKNLFSYTKGFNPLETVMFLDLDSGEIVDQLEDTPFFEYRGKYLEIGEGDQKELCDIETRLSRTISGDFLGSDQDNLYLFHNKSLIIENIKTGLRLKRLTKDEISPYPSSFSEDIGNTPFQGKLWLTVKVADKNLIKSYDIKTLKPLKAHYDNSSGGLYSGFVVDKDNSQLIVIDIRMNVLMGLVFIPILEDGSTGVPMSSEYLVNFSGANFVLA
jgi:hypothetical protein